jgi:holo-[acyl-carrier protein] synthase
MLVTGVDIIEIHRVKNTVERWGDRFLQRIYTSQEISYCKGRANSLAARFAAKEAVMKALGTGLRGVGWRDVEVVRQPGKAPTVRLHGKAAQKARELGIRDLAISLSHSRDYAVASVVGWIDSTAR